MISDRYLLRAVATPTLIVLIALSVIFTSYSVTRYLAEAVSGTQAMRLAGTMIGLRVLIALEVLLPLAAYLGMIIGLGRLYTDQEMTAWQAGGLGQATMLRPIIVFAALVALIVATLSIYARPWAYGQLYSLEIAAQTRLDLTAVTPGRFYTSDDAVLYATSKSDDGHQLNDVFARFTDDDRRIVVRAAHMRRRTDEAGVPTLDFSNGHLYQVDADGNGDRVVGFRNMQWHLTPSNRVIGYKRKAAPTDALFTSTDRRDIAERQWRLSRGFAAFFLALLGIRLAHTAPRRGRALKVLAAAIGFALYYGLASIARSWVEQGSVAPLPGLYWVDAAVGTLAVAALLRRRTHY